jgi:hypothetical protein
MCVSNALAWFMVKSELRSNIAQIATYHQAQAPGFLGYYTCPQYFNFLSAATCSRLNNADVENYQSVSC